MRAFSQRPAGAFLTLVSATIFACVSLSANANEVWAVTDQAHPVIAAGSARVIALDAPAQIETELSGQLSENPGQATAQVRSRLAANARDLQQRLTAAYQGVADAWSLSITRIPAVVVDRRYVVYGEPDVSKAVARIEAYRRRQP